MLTEALETMLKIMLALVLGSSAFDAPGFELRDLDEAVELDELDEIEAELLLMELGEIRKTGDELGRALIGDEHGDFEDRLADLFDDERFAGFIGRAYGVASQILEQPRLVRILESRFEPLNALESGSIEARFVESCDPLRNAFDEQELFDSLVSQQAQLRSAGIFRLDERAIGRKVLDEVYDPAATPKMANMARSIVRFIARMLAVQYVTAAEVEPTYEYIEGLFADSEHDVDNLGSLFASMFMPNAEHGAAFPIIDLRLESIRYRTNSMRMRRVLR